MDQAEKDRIAKLIGMFGSDFDNERAIAAKKISQMAKDKKISIVDMLKQCFATTIYQHQSHQKSNDFWDDMSKRADRARAKAEEIRRNWEKQQEIPALKILREFSDEYGVQMLSEWEQNFVLDIVHRNDVLSLSTKQMAVIQRVLDKYNIYKKQSAA